MALPPMAFRPTAPPAPSDLIRHARSSASLHRSCPDPIKGPAPSPVPLLPRASTSAPLLPSTTAKLPWSPLLHLAKPLIVARSNTATTSRTSSARLLDSRSPDDAGLPPELCRQASPHPQAILPPLNLPATLNRAQSSPGELPCLLSPFPSWDCRHHGQTAVVRTQGPPHVFYLFPGAYTQKLGTPTQLTRRPKG